MKPIQNKIQLDIPEVKIGVIQSDTVAEKGTIIAIGENVDPDPFTVGKTLYFKAWGVDVITIEGKKYYFISDDCDAICAIE